MSAAPTLLVARTILRAWRRHPLRALAAVVGVVLGAALATLVVSINDSVSHAAQSANGIEMVRADLAIGARSAGGMSYALARRLRDTAGSSKTTAVIQVNSRSGRGGLGERSVISVLGVDRNAKTFFPGAQVKRQSAHRAKPGAPGLVVGKAWLDRNGYRVGERIELVTPRGTAPWTVVGTIRGDLPNDGAIAVGDIESVGFAFDRQDSIDALYIQVAPQTNVAALGARLRAAAGAAATVGPPDSIGATSARSLVVVQAMLFVAGIVGLLSAAIVVFVCWRLLLEDERANIARFRLTGATPGQLAGGAGIVLLGATLLCCAVGVPAGITGARLLRGFTAQLVGFTGLSTVPTTNDVARAASAGLIGALAIGCAAWISGVRSFVRTSALAAVRPPDPPPPPSGHRLFVVTAAMLTILLAFVMLLSLPVEWGVVVVLLAIGGALLIALAMPSYLGQVLRIRNGGFVPLAAGRHLAADSRRTTAIIVMVGVSIAAGLTLGGVANSYQSAIDRSVRSWTQADLYVRLGRPGQTLRDARFPPEVQQRLSRLTGVAQAGAFTYLLIDYQDRNVMLQAYDTSHIKGIADLISYDGTRGDAMWKSLAAGEVAISQSMARLDSLKIGDSINLPSTDGFQRVKVASIIDDYLSDGGTIVASTQTFAKITGERRIDDFPIRLTPGASTAAVAAEIRKALPEYRSLTVLDRHQFRADITAFITNIVALFRGLALASFFIVLLAATLTLAASLAVRRRSLALSQVCGESPRQIRAQLCIEAAAMAITAWIVAAVLAGLLIPATLRASASKTGLLPSVMLPTPELAFALPIGLGVSLVAALFVARMTLGRDVVDTLRFE